MTGKKLSEITNVVELEECIHDTQYLLIKEKYGERAAEIANYGWGTTELENGVHVTTKIYGHGKILSEAHIGDNEIKSEFI
jgi:hypothetical protein